MLPTRGGHRPRPAEERFWEKVNKDGPVPTHRPDLGSCWLWTAFTTPNGYGYFERIGAHVFAYRQHNGAIPTGMVIDHLCRTRCCVNPSHLEVVTGRENILRGISFSARNAQLTHCKHGHPFTPENTRWRKNHPGHARTCRTCDARHQRDYQRRKRERMAANAA